MRADPRPASLAVSLRLDERDPARCETACFALGALSVSLFDAADTPVLEPAPGETPLWPHTRLEALFDTDCNPLELLPALARALDCRLDQLELRAVTGRAWEREWLRDFHAQRFGKRLWVIPSHEQAGAGDAVVVRLDPGLAFGTGTHPSTRLCLEWLDAHPPQGLPVIDYGCGSGILGIAACKLGASSIAAFDIDPQALIATSENARANGCSARVELHDTAATLPVECRLLLANILANTLIELAADLAARVARGGRIVLAGIFADQAPEVTAAYRSLFDIEQAGEHDRWVCLEGRRI